MVLGQKLETFPLWYTGLYVLPDILVKNTARGGGGYDCRRSELLPKSVILFLLRYSFLGDMDNKINRQSKLSKSNYSVNICWWATVLIKITYRIQLIYLCKRSQIYSSWLVQNWEYRIQQQTNNFVGIIFEKSMSEYFFNKSPGPIICFIQFNI